MLSQNFHKIVAIFSCFDIPPRKLQKSCVSVDRATGQSVDTLVVIDAYILCLPVAYMELSSCIYFRFWKFDISAQERLLLGP